MEQDHVWLKWNRHEDTLTSVFTSLLESEKLVDCIVSAEGQCLKVHQIVLSACSPYFEMLFSQHYDKYPIIVLPDVKFQMLKAIIYFMYRGEVAVAEDNLDSLLRLADFLQIKGLSQYFGLDVEGNKICEKENDATQHSQALPSQPVLASDFLSDIRQETQRVQETNISVGNPPQLCFQKKRSRDVSAAHKRKESDQCSVSGYRTRGSSLKVKEVKTEALDNTNKMGSIPHSTSTGLNNTETLVNDVRNESGATKTVFPSPHFAISTEQVVDELVYDPVVPTGVQQESECEDFEDSMEIILLDDQDESARDLSEIIQMTSKQPLLNSESRSRELAFGQADGGRDLEQEPIPVTRNQSSPYKCPGCGRMYQLRSSLRRHEKYECGKEPHFKCLYCKSRYTQRVHLKFHMWKQHKVCLK